ncbi:hypothetical protein B0T22DRAFT_294206 [Podospora appendiculata]|uniref:Uncharacterized protein n=1 Tax=Podospora appendiculata TaxID=314037 RepID=A0AAE0X1E9_9PEZI|nr:hypothetical protein B0T22DRAFT_294206 [Podospora appendiculata]
METQLSPSLATSRSLFSSYSPAGFPTQINEMSVEALNRIFHQKQVRIPVSFKYYLEARGKRARRREWTEKIVMIEDIRISFWDRTSGLQLGLMSRDVPSISPFHILASLVPDPGYSKTRPYVVSLSTLNGATYLLEAATYAAGRELVTAINYKSARLTPQIQFPIETDNAFDCLDIVAATGQAPEYGWNQKAQALFASLRNLDRSDVVDREAIRRMGDDMGLTSKWYPPTNCLEPEKPGDMSKSDGDRVEDLKLAVKRLDATLRRHNDVRANMQMIFTAGGKAKKMAMTNWETKSSYLLRV